MRAKEDLKKAGSALSPANFRQRVPSRSARSHAGAENEFADGEHRRSPEQDALPLRVRPTKTFSPGAGANERG